MRFAARIAAELVLFGNWVHRGFRKPPPFNATETINRPRESGPSSYPEEP